MNSTIFFVVLAIGEALVVLQGILAYLDGYLTQAQMHRRGITHGWSFMQHGGVVAADVLLVSPAVAYIVASDELNTTVRGLAFLAFCFLFTWVCMAVYNKAGQKNPEAHTHHGQPTPAGWVHGLYAALALWVMGEFYLGFIASSSKAELLAMAWLLTLFFPLGVIKFSWRWVRELTKPVVWQVAVEIVGVWAIYFYRTA